MLNNYYFTLLQNFQCNFQLDFGYTSTLWFALSTIKLSYFTVTSPVEMRFACQSCHKKH